MALRGTVLFSDWLSVAIVKLNSSAKNFPMIQLQVEDRLSERRLSSRVQKKFICNTRRVPNAEPENSTVVHRTSRDHN